MIWLEPDREGPRSLNLERLRPFLPMRASMRTDLAKPIRLADYRPPDYLIDTVDLDISLDAHATRVLARLSIRPNPKGRAGADLTLDGDGLVAKRILLDGAELDVKANFVTPDALTIASPPRRAFTLEIETEIDPSANTFLMGLYRSGSAYCTQCEAEGFRRITYFLDRPDVLSVYTTRVEADIAEAPVLLSNGNLVEAGKIAGTTRHFAIWHDPYPKPCYLFALVGGDLGAIHDSFITASGRKVALGIYVEHGKENERALCDGRAETRHALGRSRPSAANMISTCSTSSPSPISTWARWRTRVSTSSTTNMFWRPRRPRPTPIMRRSRQ